MGRSGGWQCSSVLTLYKHYSRYLNSISPSLYQFFIPCKLEMPSLDVTPAANPLLIRDFKTLITPNETQRNTLIIVGVYIIVIAIVWLYFLFLQNFGALIKVITLKACSIL